MMQRLSIERVDGSRARLLTLIGLLLIPLTIAGGLVWALWSPTDRLNTVHAAIVNNDEPVDLDGQTVPLGRQLSGALVGAEDTNYTWTITDQAGADAGLADGTYAAVVTIPEEFSAAATSFSGDAADAKQATIDVTTSERSKLLDDAITSVITTTASSLMGQQLTENFLENIFLGFNTIGDELGTAADGAGELSDGLVELADGTAQLNDGAQELAANMPEFTDGASQLASGAQELSGGASQLSSGANDLSSGIQTFSSGVNDLNGGASSLAAGIGQYTGGVNELSAGLNQLNAGASQLPDEATANQLTTQLGSVQSGLETASGALTEQAGNLNALAASCVVSGGSPEFCGQLANVSGGISTIAGNEPTTPGISDLVAGSGQLNDAVTPLVGSLPALSDGIAASAGGAQTLASSGTELSTGANTLADGTQQLSSGATTLAGGASALAGGTNELADGASQLATGAVAFSDGASELSVGITSLAEGTSGLAEGAGEASTGAVSLADGLGQAVDAIPSYSDAESKQLSTVVASPVASSDPSLDFGTSSAPLYAALALWLGALATFLVLRAAPKNMLGSTQSSTRIAFRSLLTPALLGVAQAILVAGVLQLQLKLGLAEWFGFAGLLVLVALAFAAVNQALVVLLGGTGRFVSLLIAVLTLGGGIISTAPAFLQSLAGAMPTGQAEDMLRAATLGIDGLGGGIVAIIAWMLLSFAVTAIALASRRSNSSYTVLQNFQRSRGTAASKRNPVGAH
ncbi:YhgE/Pip family protein [Humidisolicoccus flavus]|uniref:YhgE/Pip family protein n=1 Tax=Humidisolicoccus flavus TaxID=3111414 RepID=UPI00324EECA1